MSLPRELELRVELESGVPIMFTCIPMFVSIDSLSAKSRFPLENRGVCVGEYGFGFLVSGS